MPDLGKLTQFLSELREKEEQCDQKGEHTPVWFGYVVTSRSNPLTDSVKGYCERCRTSLKRPLNSSEIKEIQDFRKQIHESFVNPPKIRRAYGLSATYIHP